MADSNIGSLPLAEGLDDDSLLVAEQQGQAVKVTGAQFKEFGRQAVVGQVQAYVDQAQAAAEQAVSTVSAVTDMTVEATNLDNGQPATVTKSTKNGKVNLAFGLPRGEQGIAGPEGKRGPQGPPGNGLTILGYYDTEANLKSAVTAPEAGDAYGVGTAAPYDIYVFDGVTNDWKNNGPLSGGGGNVLPENVVTSEGGAVLEIPAETFGDAPHTILFTEEEDTPLTADDIEYGSGSVKDALDGLFTSVSDGKALIASAVTDKGVDTAPDAPFAEMAENIGKIQTGGDTSDSTATPSDILAPKTAYTAAGKVEGIIPSLPAQTITPGTADMTIANGQYLAGTQTIQGDANLASANIRKGVSIFGVPGAMTSEFKATLTVTADVGAVVTATHANGTELEALSTTGTVTFELPIEGTWTVTARRGVAQYNSVAVEVSSSYNAALTAEVHIERLGVITPLGESRYGIAATTIGGYALFGGGNNGKKTPYAPGSYAVDAYNSSLTHSTPKNLSSGRLNLAAASGPSHAMFGGGESGALGTAGGKSYKSNDVDAYNSSLTRTTPTDLLGIARTSLAAASVGGYVLFGGGVSDEGYSALVDAYDDKLTRSVPSSELIQARHELGAAANDNYALFAGGRQSQYSNMVDAYDKNLTRTTPTMLTVSRSELAASKAGSYILFGGGYAGSSANIFDTVDAYDLFLTRTTPEVLNVCRYNLAATSINGFCLFGGGNTAITADGQIGTVDVYDPYLTHTIVSPLDNARYNISAASVGNYALFGGGYRYGSTSVGNVYSPEVDAYRYV